MSKKLNSIMLIDDSEMDNFFHKVIINKSQAAENVMVAENGHKALQLLSDETTSPPDLILLDINMPGMNGWEFLDEYKKLDEGKKAHTHIVMLSTSLNPDDRRKAESIPEVSEYRSKPLSPQMLSEILERYFG